MSRLSQTIFFATTLILIALSAACNKYEWTLDYPIIFNGEIQYGSVTDIEGNIYKTVHIDDKWWMAQNLSTALFNDGDSVPNVVKDLEWASIDEAAYCWYENDMELFGETFGALYNWHAAASEKLCPAGWHVPSDSEWSSLVSFIGGMNTAGTKLREISDTHWGMSESKATNEFGFTAIPGGVRFSSGMFAEIGGYAYWWSSTEDTVITDWSRYWSIRCVKD